MAHFAKIEDGVVVNVVVVSNEHEAEGEAYLNGLGLEGVWVQTSYNGNFRGKFAGLGDVYNSEEDRFEPAKPFASWVWNEEGYNWQAPVAYPEDGGNYTWDEGSGSWIEAS